VESRVSESQTADLALMRELNERIVLNLIRTCVQRAVAGADDSERCSRDHP